MYLNIYESFVIVKHLEVSTIIYTYLQVVSITAFFIYFKISVITYTNSVIFYQILQIILSFYMHNNQTT